MLLLFKEKLRQLSPTDSDEVLIKNKLVPKQTPNGIQFVGDGSKTIDVAEIQERFEALGIDVEWKRVNTVVELRNRLEHYKVSATAADMNLAVADTFTVVGAFNAEHLGETPLDLLGDETWGAMLEQFEVYAQMKVACEEEIAKISWSIPALDEISEHFICHACEGELLKPVDPSANDFDLKFVCQACGETSYVCDMAEAACNETFNYDIGVCR